MLYLVCIHCDGCATVEGPFDNEDERTEFADKYLIDEQETIAEFIDIDGSYNFRG